MSLAKTQMNAGPEQAARRPGPSDRDTTGLRFREDKHNGVVGLVPGRLPTQHELPSDDGVPLETPRHRLVMTLLIECLEMWFRQRVERGDQGGQVEGNMFLYFSEEQTRNNDFRGPDVMVAYPHEREEVKSWVVWEQGKPPDIVIELLSESTREHDKANKKAIYQDKAKVPEYYWFDPFDPEDFAGFVFDETGKYQAIQPDEDGRLESRCLGLRLGPWKGRYRGVDAVWLRWYTADGTVLPTDEERADAAAQRAAAEAQRAAAEAQRAAAEAQRADAAAQRAAAADQRADAEAQRVAELSRKLRELGIDPNEL